MDCRGVDRNELVEKYLNGQLDEALQNDFEIHILECATCLQTVQALQEALDDLQERAYLLRTLPGRSGWHRRLWLVTMAASVLVAVGAVGLLRPWQTPKRWKPVTSGIPAGGGNTNAAPPDHPPSAPLGSHAVTASKNSPSFTKRSASVPHAGDGKLTATTPSDGQLNQTDVANVQPHPDVGQSTAPIVKSAQESEEAAQERFRLGIVQPPAYAFSGLPSVKPGIDSRRAPIDSLGQPSGANAANSVQVGRGLFASGMEAYVAGRYSTAASLLESAVQTDPGAPDINFYLGICRLMLGNPADAVRPLRNVLAGKDSSFTQSAHFFLAKAYVQTNDLAEAEAEFRKAVAMPGRLTTEACSLLNRLQILQGEAGNTGCATTTH